VRQDGRLLLGDLSFDCKSPVKDLESFHMEWLHFICRFLGWVLCLSRIVTVTLAVDKTSTVDSYHQSEVMKDGIQDTVFYIVQGESLKVQIPHCHCTSTHFHSLDTTQISPQDPSILHINIEGNSDKVISLENGLQTVNDATLFDLKHSQPITSPHLFTIHALQPGTVTLRLYSHVGMKNGRQVTSLKNIPFEGVVMREKKCCFKVVVVPELYPVQSLELQELIGLLNEYSHHHNPRVLLQAQYFRMHNPKVWSKEYCARMFALPLQELAQQWKEIDKEVNLLLPQQEMADHLLISNRSMSLPSRKN